MSDAFLIEYCKQRMAELGHKNYHYEPVRVASATNSKDVSAYNEYYYLVSKPPAGIKIISDTNSFNETETIFEQYSIQEFSGLIQISINNETAIGFDLEFLRFVPSTNHNQ